jgi:hypothetical protein
MRTPIESVCWRHFWSTEAPASQFASASGPRYRLAEDIGFAAIVVTKWELRQIQRQVFFAHVVIRPDDLALQQSLEAFDVVGANLAAHIFMRLVICGRKGRQQPCGRHHDSER